ncbi:MAG: MarR family transcriptional regulator [Caldilinea sp. CFX5]|nr:MarR family transcriptional regulator [Caldilinea sp. CFX5]
MTIRDRIIDFLQARPEGIDDDSLAAALKLKQRQQASSRCRQLAQEGHLVRQMVNGKIHNIWRTQPATDASIAAVATPATPTWAVDTTRSWFWEGNVQTAVASYLVSQAYAIHSLADTATKARGKDLMAVRNGIPLWITVKGYPTGTAKTRPSTQAGHWFKQAVFDIIAYRGEDANAELGLALPAFPRYHTLAHKIAWFQPVAGFAYYWVQENGTIVVEAADNQSALS